MPLNLVVTRASSGVFDMMQKLEGTLQQANLSLQNGCLQEAWGLYERALALSPGCAMAYNNLGIILMEWGQYEQAVSACRQAVAFEPKRADYVLNLACAYQHAGELELALSCCSKAVDLDPQRPESYYNWASVLRELNHIEEAIDKIQQALVLKPDFREARWTLSHLYLLNEQYHLGWKTDEWWQCELQPLRFAGGQLPERWTGQALQGQRVLILWEQGFGDNLQFLRFLQEVKQRGATVVLEAPPEMTRLVQRCHGIDEVVPLEPGHAAIRDCQFYVPMLALAEVFGIQVQNIPFAGPYVWADPQESQVWLKRRLDHRPHIGVVWSGEPTHGNNVSRSCPMEMLTELWEVAEIQWVSLQKGRAGDGLLPEWVWDWASECHDFADTAAAMSALDMVISVDTASLHLAGAMGKPAWGLISYAPDWRWHLRRSDSPWYPHMRLLRQKSRGDWGRVLKKLHYLITEDGCLQTFFPKGQGA